MAQALAYCKEYIFIIMLMELYHKSKNKLNINKVIRVYIQYIQYNFDGKHIFFVFYSKHDKKNENRERKRVCLRVCKIKSNC